MATPSSSGGTRKHGQIFDLELDELLAGSVVQTSVPELNKLFGSRPHLEGHLADLRVEWEPFQVKDAVVFGIVPPQKDDTVLVTLVYAVFSGPETALRLLASFSQFFSSRQAARSYRDVSC